MRIAHISDFHLRHHLTGTSAADKRRSREMVDLYPRALERMLGATPDLLVLSGDLVDHPFEDMNSVAHLEAGEADLRWHRQMLENVDVPVVVLPGNHDHLKLFHEVFDLVTDQEVCGTRIVSFADAEGEEHVPCRVGAERTLFDTVLKDSDPRPQVHLQHYLVYPRRDEGYPHTYEDGEQMQAAMAQCGSVRLSLSGHYHPGHDPECVNGTWFSVAPAFCESPHAWRIYDLDPTTGDLTWQQQELGSR